MSSKVLFAMGDLRIGGVARVQSVIVNELNRRGYAIDLFSFRETESYYPLFKEVTFARKSINKQRFRSLLVRTGVSKYILRKTVDMITRPNDSHFEDLVSYINKNGFNTVVLVEQWIIYAEQLKERFPKMKLIGWLHLDLEQYETYHLAKSREQFLNGLKFCDSLIALTQAEKLKLEECGLNNVQVIYNPITVEETERAADLNQKIISYVGRIDIYGKGLDYLLEVAKRLPDEWVINMAGSGRDDKKFKRLIIKEHLQDKILWEGPKREEELTSHYLNSSIFLMTSRFESFGLVLVEAMNYSLPVVAFSQTGSDEILQNEEYGLSAEMGDISELLEKLEKLTSSIEQRLFWSKKSKIRSRDFSLEKISREWDKILLESNHEQ